MIKTERKVNKMYILSVKPSQGTYTNKMGVEVPYDNYNVYIIDDDEKAVGGYVPLEKPFKVKKSDWNEHFGFQFSEDEVDTRLINKDVDVYYDKYGRIKSVVLVEVGETVNA